jgi:CRP/FNR family transcriptional regulator, anaerobic regulatory protein
MFEKKTNTPFDFSLVFERSLLDEIDSKGMNMAVAHGQALIDVGQSIQGVPLVRRGVFKVSTMNEDGQEMLLYYVNPGESCAMTFTCCMAQQESAIKATAEEDGEFLIIPVYIVEEWLSKYATWRSFVMRTVMNRFQELLKMIDSITFKKMDERLVDYLKQKSKVTGSALINLSHQEIADELATNRVVISRLLKKMEDEKMLLLYRNQVKLLSAM